MLSHALPRELLAQTAAVCALNVFEFHNPLNCTKKARSAQRVASANSLMAVAMCSWHPRRRSSQGLLRIWNQVLQIELSLALLLFEDANAEKLCCALVIYLCLQPSWRTICFLLRISGCRRFNKNSHLLGEAGCAGQAIHAQEPARLRRAGISAKLCPNCDASSCTRVSMHAKPHWKTIGFVSLVRRSCWRPG